MTARLQHALIMAAGRGHRMMPLTADRPKAMAPYQGITLIAHGIQSIATEVAHVHVTVGYKGAMLAEHVIHHGAATVFNTEGHGNCWWVYNTFLSLLDEPVLVLTCDNVMDLDFDLLMNEYFEVGAPACMVVPVRPVPGLEGDYIFHDGDHVVTGLSRERPAPSYCSGIQIVNPARVGALTDSSEHFGQLWAQLIEQRQLRSSRVYPKQWFTFDTVAQLEAHAEMQLSTGASLPTSTRQR